MIVDDFLNEKKELENFKLEVAKENLKKLELLEKEFQRVYTERRGNYFNQY